MILKYDHEYTNPDVYNLIWHSSEGMQLHYATIIAELVARKGIRSPKMLEIFGGDKRILPYLTKTMPRGFLYQTLDAFATADHACDANDFTLTEQFDVIFTTYNSICATIHNLRGFFASCKKALRPGGMMIFHRRPWIDSLTDDWPVGTHTQSFDYTFAMKPTLRNLLDPKVYRGHKPNKVFTVEYTRHIAYDRLLGRVLTSYVGPIKIKDGSKIVSRITIKEGITFHQWSETVIGQTLLGLGFDMKKVDLHSELFGTNIDLRPHKHVLHNDDDLAEMDESFEWLVIHA